MQQDKKELAIVTLRTVIKDNTDWRAEVIHKGCTKLLLKEYLRRMWLWTSRTLGYVSMGRDIAFEVLGHKVAINEIEERVLSGMKMQPYHFDKLVMSWYANFMVHEDEIRQKYGYDLPNPYEVFLWLYKKGNVNLRLNASLIEFYPFASTSFGKLDKETLDIPYITLDDAALDAADRLYQEDPKNEVFR
jgi:hypothetical protein